MDLFQHLREHVTCINSLCTTTPLYKFLFISGLFSKWLILHPHSAVLCLIVQKDTVLQGVKAQKTIICKTVLMKHFYTKWHCFNHHYMHVRNEEVLLWVNEQRNILHEIRKQKVNWIGHILRQNCLLKQVIEGKIKGEIEVTRRRVKKT
jgi:hypothetical protein